MKSSRVLLGLSGGADSSVAALLLQKQGYEVVAVTFLFLDQEKEKQSFLEEVKHFCKKTEIEHFFYDARERFQQEVVDYFIDEYLIGRTPFPCVKCNNFLKWELLMDLSEKLHCTYISTGHYADIEEYNGFQYISEAFDEDKNQAFFLWGLHQKILKKTIFPLSGFTKDEVRKIALENGFLDIASKKDSMGVCFCPGDYRDFLKKQERAKKHIRKGNFVDENGSFLGRHEGFPFYTIGQRYGLGIQLNKSMYVKNIIPEKNLIVLAPFENTFCSSVLIENYHLINPLEIEKDCSVITKIRYRKQATLSKIEIISKNRLKVHFCEPVSAIAPGQSAVFYKDNRVLGGGFILE